MKHNETKQIIITHIQAQTEPFSLASIHDEVRSQGARVSVQHVRTTLTSLGYTCRRVHRRTMWWQWDENAENENENEDDVAEKKDDASSLDKRNDKNTQMAAERDALWAAVQKTVDLRNEIKSAQERLLVEIADLIHSTYGQTATPSPTPSPRESETPSEVD